MLHRAAFRPQHIEFSVVRTDLAHLIVHVGQIAVEIAVIIFVGRIVPHRMVLITVVREIVVEPVKQGKIKSDFQPLCADRLDILCDGSRPHFVLVDLKSVY